MRFAALFAAIFALLTGAAQAQSPQTASAIFAGGCFWCMEPPFDKTPGVTATTSGYSGGPEVNPTYEQVSAGTTGHYEVVKVDYDPSKVSYEKLLEVYWPNIDPTDAAGQFCDKGPQYRSVIFYGNEKEKDLAEASLKAVSEKLGKKVETQILPATAFYPAEGYHQDYYLKNPIKYKFYRYGCGRDARLDAVWGAKK
ncbi:MULTISPECIES: peptide-methionine (S)-S-oxide reductase MsrA [Rhodomicrobium]|uniref:peptide-methionine (S)-S-oxide reductase MsrA n=1 Tax=Rhodomicrobium TaxID=1068 RepID=UPI000B4B6DAA|nr:MULTISPECIES: peptide-methionine (S)-S-oxide reductase MsrA [Rhodomicrobium]